MGSRYKGDAVFAGWYVVLGSFLIMLITYGVRYSFGVFVKPMLAEYGWSMTIIQLGSSINLIVYASTGVFTGWLMDRIAPKWIMIVGILVTSAGLILAGQVKSPLGLYVAYGVLVGAGSSGCGMVVCTSAVGKWFDRRKGLAIGISSMGIGVGTMLMAPLAGYIVKYHGWRSGFLSIGITMTIVGIFISFVFMGKKSPGDSESSSESGRADTDTKSLPFAMEFERKPSLKPVLKTIQYWILVFCNACAVMTVMLTFNLQIVYAIHQGINALEAAAALGLIGVTGSCGKFFFGWLCDRVRDAKYAASAGFMIMAVGIFILYQVKTVALLYPFALIYGFGYGSLAPVMPYLVSDLFGRQLLGATYGLLIFFAFGLGGSIGPLLGGFIYDKTGTYDVGWLISMLALLFVGVAILALKPVGSRLR